MSEPIVRRATVWRGVPVQILDVPQKLDGNAAFVDDVVSFSIYMFDESQPEPTLVKMLEQDRDPSGFVYDDFQTDQGWSRGGDGWTFRYVIAADDTVALPAGRAYRVEIVLTTADGVDGPITMVYSLYLEPMLNGAPVV